jgi:hypothetical protein
MSLQSQGHATKPTETFRVGLLGKSMNNLTRIEFGNDMELSEVSSIGDNLRWVDAA